MKLFYYQEWTMVKLDNDKRNDIHNPNRDLSISVIILFYVLLFIKNIDKLAPFALDVWSPASLCGS